MCQVARNFFKRTWAIYITHVVIVCELRIENLVAFSRVSIRVDEGKLNSCTAMKFLFVFRIDRRSVAKTLGNWPDYPVVIWASGNGF